MKQWEIGWHAFEDMVGGEIYVKKSPSMKVADVALATAFAASMTSLVSAPAEKLHEQMIGPEDAPHV